MTEPQIDAAPTVAPGRVRRTLGAAGRWLALAVLMRAWWASAFAAGWLLQLGRQATERRLHRLAGQDMAAETERWGPWLRDTARLGVHGLATTWLLCGPGMVLWWFGWRYGWDASFHKTYESAHVGPLTAVLGIVAFVAAMGVVPLSQARLALTGSLAAALDLSVLRRLARQRWPAALLLAGGYAGLGAVIMVMWMGVTFTPVNQAELAADDGWLGRHYGFFALLLVPALVALRRAAGRWYASALVGAVQAGAVGLDALHPEELGRLDALGLLAVRSHPTRHRLVRWVGWSASRAGRLAGAMAISSVWFLVVAQVFVAQFFHYRGGLGWLVLPSVTLPWVGSLP